MRFLLLLYPLAGFCAVTNVRVMQTTPTQAIVAYTAPDNTACTVAVSTSPSYSPLVYDVDPALFTGANLDTRTGSLSIGRARVFVVGNRSVAADLSANNRSRALSANTTYYFQITCPSDSSTGSGQFTTLVIPNGSGYGEPIPSDPGNSGSYIYPALSTTDRTASVTDPHTGAVVKNFVLPGDLQGGLATGMTATGTGSMCHPTPVKASDENKYGYHCQIYLSSSFPALYWIASDGETRLLGIMRSNTGTNGGFGYNTFACNGSLGAPFDSVDPNSYYCIINGNSAPYTNSKVVLKATYTGHNVLGQDVDLTNLPTAAVGGPHLTWTVSQPFARDLITLLSEFDPSYASVGVTCCTSFRGGDWITGPNNDNKYMFYVWGASQDTLGYIAEYDTTATAATQIAQFGNAAGCIDNPAVTGSTYAGQAGCITASAGTFNGQAGSGFRWVVLHTLYAVSASAWVPVSASIPRIKGDTWYQVTLTSAMPGSASTCSMAQPAGNPITPSTWPTAAWTPGCSTVTVSGDPVLGRAKATYPSSLPALPGDLLSITSADYVHHEIVRLLDKGADGNTYYVQRQWFSDQLWTSCNYSRYGYTAVAQGATMDMLPYSIYPDCNTTGTQVWWDPINGAQSTNGNTVLVDTLPQGHPAYINNPLYGRWTYVSSDQAIYGQEPGRLLNPPPFLPMPPPWFNGIGPLALESHPALSVSNPPNQDTYLQAIDGRPYYGDTTTVTSGHVSVVSGLLFKVTGTTVANNYKLAPYFGTSGTRAMRELSGPSVSMATDTSNQFRWCVALNANECYSGSSKGDIYFNAPHISNCAVMISGASFTVNQSGSCYYNGNTLAASATVTTDGTVKSTAYVWIDDGGGIDVAYSGASGLSCTGCNSLTPSTSTIPANVSPVGIVSPVNASTWSSTFVLGNLFCTYDWLTLQTTFTIPNDVCISPANSTTQGIIMHEIANDPTGLQLRVLTNSMSQYDQETVFWNSRTIPDGSWAFTTLAAYPNTIKLVQIPPREKASLSRIQYMPVSVSVPGRAGLDNVMVEFGYAENGSPTNYYCTARQESCVAQGATISSSTPFYFETTESGSITGTPCSSGCTIAIPAISTRVLYYRINLRNSLNQVIGQIPGIQAVP